jgi:transposase
MPTWIGCVRCSACRGRAVLTPPPSVRIWSATAPTDLRRGFDGLAALVRAQLQADPLSGHLFVFFNRRADRRKVLYWDRDGLCLWYKRLEQGRFLSPAADAASLGLTPGHLQMILDGADVERVRRYKRCQLPASA